MDPLEVPQTEACAPRDTNRPGEPARVAGGRPGPARSPGALLPAAEWPRCHHDVNLRAITVTERRGRG